MIIKNNFNKDSAEPLSNYESIRRSCDNNVNDENKKKALQNEKKIMNNLSRNEDSFIKENDELDIWHF